MRRSSRSLAAHAVGALPWLVLTAAAAFGLSVSIYGALVHEGVGLGTPPLMLRTFALIIGAIGVVRSVRRETWRIGDASWLGLPARDWAFAGGFSVTASVVLWLAV